MKIANMSQYHTALASIETLIEKGVGNLTADEENKLEKLSIEVEEFEKSKYPIPMQVSVQSVLEYYMYTNRINQSGLSKLLEVPDSTVSALLNGKKKLNMELAKKLHNKLNIDANLLLQTA